MKLRISFGGRLFLTILLIFIAYGACFALYLIFDVELSKTLHDDYLFLGFLVLLTITLLLVLRWYTRRISDMMNRRQDEVSAEVRRQMTQNISHELKTPVAGIQGYLETLLENPDIPAETRQQFLQRSLGQTVRLNALIRDIALLNKMDDAPDFQKFETVDITALIQTMKEETAEAFAAKGMTFELALPESVPVQGNPSLLYSIFRNLIDNALAYAGSGTSVRLQATPGRKGWAFVFQDDGVGVPPEHLPRIFERFYRVDSGRSRKLGGTGLGLAVVKNAVLLHGGTISARSAEPHGLRFDFTLGR